MANANQYHWQSFRLHGQRHVAAYSRHLHRRGSLPDPRSPGAAEWADGKATAGYQSAKAKHNPQLPQDHPLAREIGEAMLQRLWNHPLFMSAALPLKVFPPLFNCYTGGGSFDFHIDNAVRDIHGGRERVRTDLSSTLFFSDPEDYDGGELVIQDTYGLQQVKLPAGDLVLYPGTSLHKVNPVTRGARYASFFWTQSLVREDSQRTCYSKWTSRSSDSPVTSPTIPR